MVETGEAVFRFKRVVSLLNTGLGHARVRKLKKLPIPLPQSILLDNPNCRTERPSKSSNFLQPSFPENPLQDMGSNVKSSLCVGNPSLELSSSGKTPIQLAQQATPHYRLLQQQQQQQQQKLLFQQQMKHQAEMMFRKSNSGINLNFDSSSCTPTMSSTRSFISSLSMDGSVANLDGNAFHLIGAPRSSDQNSQHKRKCSGRGDDGSVKCGSSGRCHCSKKRFDLAPRILFGVLLLIINLVYANFTPFPQEEKLDFVSCFWLHCSFSVGRKHRIKRSIKVPAISNKLADIPPDDYSWRKYGQKPIKGSPHPRYIICIFFLYVN